MEAVALLWKSRLRRRWRAWLVLAVLLGLGAGAGLTCLAGARRTASSFERISAATNEPDINTSHGLTPAEADMVVAGFTGVAAHQTVVGFTGFVDDVDPTLVKYFLGPWAGPLSFSSPVLRAGREPHPGRVDEVMLTGRHSESAGLRPGVRLTVRLFGAGEEPEVRSVEVTGIGSFADEVASDAAYDRPGMIFTPAFTEANAHLQGWSSTMLAAAPGVDVETELVQQLAAAGWSSDEVRSVNRSRVQDALRPLAITLALLGALVLTGALVVTSQALARQRDAVREDGAAARAMGFTPGQARSLDLLTVLSVAVPGAVLAWATALGLSPLFPVGSVRPLEPERGFSLDATVLGLGALVVIGLLLATSRLGSRRTGSLANPVPPRLALLGRLGPSAGAGVRQALGATAHDRRRFWTTVAFSAVPLALVLGGVVFVSALDRLSAEPRRYGVGWDLTARNGYGDVDPEALRALVTGDEDITGVTAADLTILLLDDKVGSPALGVLPVTASLWPTVVEGHAPGHDDEILVGQSVLDELDAAVGDRIKVRLAFAPTDTEPPSFTLTVAGTAIFPSVELAGVDPTRLGSGVAMTWDRFLSLQPPDDSYVPLPDITFFDLAEGVDGQTIVDRYADGLPETSGFSVTEWLPSLAPAEVRETEQAIPLIWAVIVFLGFTVIATIANAVAATVRRQRRDYAILKALGLRRGQVRATVAWQAVTPVAVALAVGLPLGVAAGRWASSRFAQLVQVVDAPIVPGAPLLAVVLGALAASALVALGPGLRAARVPALTLHQG